MEGTIGEIRLFAAPFAPKYWAYCTGTLVAIRTNTALFSILGTTYGGDGQTTFALPSLGGRTAIGTGPGSGLPLVDLGEMGGMPTTTLTIANLAPHTHAVSANVALPAFSEEGDTGVAANNVILAGKAGAFSDQNDVPMAPIQSNIQVSPAGGTQAISNIQPSIGMNYIVCMYGVFPQRPY